MVPRDLEQVRVPRPRRERRRGRARSRAHPRRGPVVVARLRERARGDDRLVRRADEHRPRRARGVRGHGRARPRATRRQPALLRRRRAAAARPTCSRARSRWSEQLRHKLLSRYRAHGLLGVGGGGDIFGGIGPAKPDPRLPGYPGRTALREELVATGELVPVDVENVRGKRFVLRAEVDLLERPPEPAALSRIPAAVRSAGVGPEASRLAVRVRVRLGALRPASQAALGLVRAASALRRPPRRADRAAHRPRRRPGAGARPLVGGRLRAAPHRGLRRRDARRAPRLPALRVATRIEWAPELATEKRLFLTRP